MPTIDTTAYKLALSRGDRVAIIAAARDIVVTIGKAVLSADPPNVNANAGQDNSKELDAHQTTFNIRALHFTDTVDGYNRQVLAGSSGMPEAAVLQQQLQALESSYANITEIERINKGDKIGTGGGFDIPPSTPKWAIGLLRDVAAIKEKVGA